VSGEVLSCWLPGPAVSTGGQSSIEPCSPGHAFFVLPCLGNSAARYMLKAMSKPLICKKAMLNLMPSAESGRLTLRSHVVAGAALPASYVITRVVTCGPIDSGAEKGTSRD
jgi:hypothetical protein